MIEYCFAAGYERTAITDYHTTVGAQVSQSSTQFKNGTNSMKIDMSTATANGSVYMENKYLSLRKAAIRFDFYPTANIAVNTWDLVEFFSNSCSCQLQQTGKIQIYAGVGGHSALTSNTVNLNAWNTGEFFADLDYGGSFGTIGIYLNGTLTTYQLVSGDIAISSVLSRIALGFIPQKGSVSPGMICYFDNVFVYLTGGTTALTQIGTVVCEENSRVPVAVGTANDFTADSGTLKYDRVNESPSDGDTSYVYQDVVGGPITNCTPAVGAAGILNGNYTYTTTFVTADGETDTAGLRTSTVSPANQQVNLTSIPIGPYNTTKRRIYRTLVNATIGPWYLVTTINDNTTTTYTDNLADGSLGAQPPTSNTATPIKRQRFKFTTVGSYSSKVKGICCFSIRKNSTSATPRPNYDSFYDNSVEYNVLREALNNSSAYIAQTQGYASRPGDQSTWTDTSINLIEAGMKIDQTTLSATTSYEERVTAQFMVVATVSPNYPLPSSYINNPPSVNQSLSLVGY